MSGSTERKLSGHEFVLKTLEDLSFNLIDVWNLGDLIDDIKVARYAMISAANAQRQLAARRRTAPRGTCQFPWSRKELRFTQRLQTDCGAAAE